jgi:ribosomal protein L37E
MSEQHNETDKKPAQQPQKPKQVECKRCGQTGYNGQYPFSTMVGYGICDDCI